MATTLRTTATAGLVCAVVIAVGLLVRDQIPDRPPATPTSTTGAAAPNDTTPAVTISSNVTSAPQTSATPVPQHRLEAWLLRAEEVGPGFTRTDELSDASLPDDGCTGPETPTGSGASATAVYSRGSTTYFSQTLEALPDGEATLDELRSLAIDCASFSTTVEGLTLDLRIRQIPAPELKTDPAVTEPVLLELTVSAAGIDVATEYVAGFRTGPVVLSALYVDGADTDLATFHDLLGRAVGRVGGGT